MGGGTYGNAGNPRGSYSSTGNTSSTDAANPYSNPNRTGGGTNPNSPGNPSSGNWDMNRR